MKVLSPHYAPISMNWMSQKPKHLSFGSLGNTRTKLITQTNCWESLLNPSLKNHTLFVGTYSGRNVADKNGLPGTTTDSDSRRQIIPQQTRLCASHCSARFDNCNKGLRLSGCTGSSIYLLAATIDRPWSGQGMYQQYFAWMITIIPPGGSAGPSTPNFDTTYDSFSSTVGGAVGRDFDFGKRIS